MSDFPESFKREVPIPDSTRFTIPAATPWMSVAEQQLKKRIQELKDPDALERYRALSAALTQTEIEQEKDYGFRGCLPVMTLHEQRAATLMPALAKADRDVGVATARANPEIAKYFESLPARNRPATSRRRKAGDWDVTPWCAAFVNWCLDQAQVAHLGLATAASWLRFGTPIELPVYGAVVVMKPRSQDSTGHVAFSTGRRVGEKLIILGGNQSGDRITEEGYPIGRFLGYRWPTSINFLTPRVPSNLA